MRGHAPELDLEPGLRACTGAAYTDSASAIAVFAAELLRRRWDSAQNHEHVVGPDAHVQETMLSYQPLQVAA